MAQRRMFSLKIVDTDAFLDMPQSSQLLYFHLSMRADDDGFVANPKKIMRVIGSQEDDLKVLFTKRFVLPFDSGVCVIKHWKIHNYIQNDRYMPTQYVKEKAMLDVDEETQKYRLKTAMDTESVQNVSTGKDRLGKVRKENTNTLQGVSKETQGKEVSEVISLFKEVNPSIGKYYANTSQRSAVQRMLKEHGREKLESMIKSLPTVNAKKYWPKSTTPCQLEDNLAIYKAKADEERGSIKIITI